MISTPQTMTTRAVGGPKANIRINPMGKPHSLGESVAFFGRWLRNPLSIGAVAPSSQGLARGMSKPVDAAQPGWVVELGGGTGKMTQAALDQGIDPARLLVIERDPDLHRLLVDRFPAATIVNGDATQVAEIARDHGAAPVKAVSSGLPLIGMPVDIRRAIVGGVFQVVEPGGVFVQFTYTLVSPVSAAIMQEFGLTGRWVERIWWNLPPARVWVYRRRGDADPPEATGGAD